MMSDFEHKQGCFPTDLGNMDNQFEHFELLSAYMDGELTAEERKQVQQQLDTDPEFHQLYKQLLRVQRQTTTLSVPENYASTDDLSQGVFDTIDSQDRRKKGLIASGLGIVVVLIGSIAQISSQDGLFPRYARTESEALTIALNHPVVEIPPDTSP
ncbi:anti-sigma factor family protein [Crocosphaera sp. Alani8]|uniref:anti-sigma factor family protein n=1 Tax=Crocosphaera sp. Alani8 TaxID=3038952 RepID=UPI00313EE856